MADDEHPDRRPEGPPDSAPGSGTDAARDGVHDGGPETDPRWRPSPRKVVAGLVLLAAIVVPLVVGSYATVGPRLFGFPFFYWYQLAWVFLAAGCCAIAFLLLRGEQHR